MKTKQGKASLLFSSLKMAIATMMSRVLGLVREQLMAWSFGASGFTDAFLIAYRIPNLFRDLLAEGAFSAAFVPKFVEAFNEKRSRAQKLLWSCFILLFFITLALSLGMIFFSENLIYLFSDEKFYSDPEKLSLASNMLKIMSFYLMFVCFAAVFMGVLNSLKIFFIPALAPVVFNISMIIALLFFPGLLESLGQPVVYALSIGVLIGGVGQFLLQLPFVLKKGLAPTTKVNLFHKDTKEVFFALGPGLAGFATTQLNIMVNSILATSTLVGAVSWLNYAFRLFQLPIGVIGVSLGSSHLVHFSEAYKGERIEEALGILRKSSFYAFSFILPFTMIYIGLGEEIVRLIFEHGKFNLESTQNTFLALQLYSIALPFYCIVKIYTPSFYTVGIPKMAVAASMISVAINIIFSLVFIKEYGFGVLALGTALATISNACLQLVFLTRHLKISASSLFSLAWLKAIVAALVTLALAYYFRDIYAYKSGDSLIKGIMAIASKSLVLLGSYILVLWIMGERSFIQAISKRLKAK